FFSSRRRHTRSKRDWSSDVCSSDLRTVRTSPVVAAIALAALTLGACGTDEGNGGENGETTTSAAVSVDPAAPELTEREGAYNFKIGRASCRERVSNPEVAGAVKRQE